MESLLPSRTNLGPPRSPSSSSSSTVKFPHTRARATSQSDNSTSKGINGASKLSITTGPRKGRRAGIENLDGGEFDSGSGSGSGSGVGTGVGAYGRPEAGAGGLFHDDTSLPGSRSTTPTPTPRGNRSGIINRTEENNKPASSSLPTSSHLHDHGSTLHSKSISNSPAGHLQVPSAFPIRRPRASANQDVTSRAGSRRSSTSHIDTSVSATPAEPSGEGISPRWWNGRTTSYSPSPIPTPGRTSSPVPLSASQSHTQLQGRDQVQGLGTGQARPLPPSRTVSNAFHPQGVSGRSSPSFGVGQTHNNGVLGAQGQAFHSSPATYGPASFSGNGPYEHFDTSTFDARRHPFPPPPPSRTQSQSQVHSMPFATSSSTRDVATMDDRPLESGAHGRRADRVSRISEAFEPNSPRAQGKGRRRSSAAVEQDEREEEAAWDVFREVQMERERIVKPRTVSHLIPPLTSSLTSLSLSLTTRQRSIQHTLQEFKSIAERFEMLDDEVVDGILKALGNEEEIDKAQKEGNTRGSTVGTTSNLLDRPSSRVTHNTPTSNPSSPSAISTTSAPSTSEPPPNAHTNLSTFLRAISQTRSAVDSLEHTLKEKEGAMHGVEEDLERLVPQILSELDRRIADRQASIEKIQAERVKRERVLFISSIVASVLICLLAIGVGWWYSTR